MKCESSNMKRTPFRHSHLTFSSLCLPCASPWTSVTLSKFFGPQGRYANTEQAQRTSETFLAYW